MSKERVMQWLYLDLELLSDKPTRLSLLSLSSLTVPAAISSRLITRDAFKDPKAVAKALVEAQGKLAPGVSECVVDVLRS